MLAETTYNRFPKVPIGRRGAAFFIDFFTVWLVSLLLAGNLFAQLLVFSVGWLLLRVVLVARNQGQSLGRWAFDIKVVSARFAKTPGIAELAKREGITLAVVLLTLLGLSLTLSSGGLSLLILITPLTADCGFAVADSRLQQALHDRLAQTLVVATRRGFSLDLRIKRLLAQARSRM